MKKSIEKYLSYLHIERNSSRHTITSYRNDLLQLLGFVAEEQGTDPKSVQLQSVDRLTIRLWMGELSENGITRNSIARKVAAVRSFFKYCYKRGYVQKNPAHLLIVPKKETRLPVTVALDDIKKMMKLADEDTPEIQQERAILELFYSSGIRLSELVNLNVNDVDIRQSQVTVLGKGNKQRVIPIGKKALDAYKNHLKTRPELLTGSSKNDDKKALFIAAKGGRIYPRKVQRIIEKYLSKTSEVTQKSPHTLRHSFATHMMDAGADIRMIKEFLGHSDLNSTQIYTHTSMERLQKVYSKAHPRAESNIQ
jgi:tyrosine recombinase XerC